MDFNKTLYSNIKQLCKKEGLTISSLEKELNFGGGIISRWGDKADPSLSKIIKIAEFFDVSIDELIGRDLSQLSDDFFKEILRRTENLSITWEKTSFDVSELTRFVYSPHYKGIELENQMEYIVYKHTGQNYEFLIMEKYVYNPKLVVKVNNSFSFYVRKDDTEDFIEVNVEEKQLIFLFDKIEYYSDGQYYANSRVTDIAREFLNKKYKPDSYYENTNSNPEILEILNNKEFTKIKEFVSDENNIKALNAIQKIIQNKNK